MTDTTLIIITAHDKKHAGKIIKQLSEFKLHAQTLEIPGSVDTPVEKKKLVPVTISALKEVLTKVKEELGSDVLKNLFVVHDCKKLGDLPEGEYATMFMEAEVLLNPDKVSDEDDPFDDPFDMLDDPESEDEDDLGLDDDDDDLGLEDTETVTVDLDEVKKLASKYADKHGLDDQREVMGKFGIATTRSLGKATPEQLSKIAAKFTKGLK